MLGIVLNLVLLGSDVRTLADVTGTLDIMQIRIAEDAPAAGMRLVDVRFPAGTLIVSDDGGERIAGPDTTIIPGRRYVVAVDPGVADEVLNLLRGVSGPARAVSRHHRRAHSRGHRWTTAGGP